MYLVILSVVMVAVTEVASVPVVNETDQRSPCSSYAYCDGQKFSHSIVVDDKLITCDPFPDVRQNCCMPHAKHMVCYSISYYGQYFDLDATDFIELCRVMLAEFDKVPSRHATAIVENDSGSIGFRYGDIFDTQTAGETDRHIHHLACSYQ